MMGKALKYKMYMHYVCFVSSVLLGLLATPAHAITADEKLALVEAQIEHDMKLDFPVHDTQRYRESVVEKFTKRLNRIDDFNLGDPRLRAKESSVTKQAIQSDIKNFKAQLMSIVDEYKSKVRPILLNNLKFKRTDAAADQNKGFLVQLANRNKHNHKTGRPILGLMRYPMDISDSIFSERFVDAGLLVNFPDLAEQDWVLDAINMDDELYVIRQKHRKFRDGMTFKKINPKKSVSAVVLGQAKVVESKVSPSQVNQAEVNQVEVNSSEEISVAEPLSEDKRGRMVHKFSESLRKLDGNQGIGALKSDLERIVNTYQHDIKPILVKNVNLERKDVAARGNRGDLISMFYPSSYNHKTGLPITGKLRYQKDVGSMFETKMEDAGALVTHPELAQDPIVLAALKMEEELKILLKEHRDYLKREKSFLY